MIAHIPGTDWVLRPREETRKEHDEFILRHEWIIDGQYKRLMPQRLERADTLILLKVGRFTCLIRYLRRCRIKGDRPGKLQGAKKEFNWRMVWWILYHQPKKWKEQTQIIARFNHLKPLVFHSFKEIDTFINTLKERKNSIRTEYFP